MLGTIRGRIVIAFLVMSAITGALGLSAASSIRRADELVSQTFDRSLMSINYARAAATRRDNMRQSAAALEGQLAEAKAELGEAFEELKKIEILEDRERTAERVAEAARDQAAMDGIGLSRIRA